MRIRDREITKRYKINSDLAMQIIRILKNMELETTEVVEDRLQEKLHRVLQLVQLQN